MSTFSLTLGFVDPKFEKQIKRNLIDVNVRGATWVYGHNTVFNKTLALLGLDNQRGAIVMVVHRAYAGDVIRDAIATAYKEAKKKGGMAFTLPVLEVMGLSGCEANLEASDKGEPSMNKELIIVIVDKNRGDDVIDAAQQASAPGATVLHGHGSGAEKTKHFLHLEIEPEKEIILIVSSADKTKTIIDSIRSVIDFDAPNTGILFTLEISDWMEVGK